MLEAQRQFCLLTRWQIISKVMRQDPWDLQNRLVIVYKTGTILKVERLGPNFGITGCLTCWP